MFVSLNSFLIATSSVAIGFLVVFTPLGLPNISPKELPELFVICVFEVGLGVCDDVVVFEVIVVAEGLFGSAVLVACGFTVATVVA